MAKRKEEPRKTGHLELKIAQRRKRAEWKRKGYDVKMDARIAAKTAKEHAKWGRRAAKWEAKRAKWAKKRKRRTYKLEHQRKVRLA